jgi:uncharacterized protein YqeY
MSLAERIANDLKEALRAGDTTRRSVLRLLLAAMKNAEIVKNGPLTPEEVATTLKRAGVALSREQAHRALEASWAMRRGEPYDTDLDQAAVSALAEAGATKAASAGPLSDAEVEEIIQKQAKQRRDSIEAYRQAGRTDLAANEEAELTVLIGYLPQPLSTDELTEIARQVIAETGASSQRDLGKVMPLVMARVGKRADGRAVNAVVRQLLP